MSDILEPIFGPSGVIAARFLIMLLMILLILTLLVWLIGRLSTMRPSQLFRRGQQPRLEVIDSIQVDSRRRAILIRRDNVEHLILTGGPTDVVVEHSPPNEERARPAPRPDVGSQSGERRRGAEQRHGPQRGQTRPQPGRSQPAVQERSRDGGRREPAGRAQLTAESDRGFDEGPSRRRDVAAFGGEPPRRPVPAAAQRPQPVPPAADPYAKPPRPAPPVAPAPSAAPPGPAVSWDEPVLHAKLEHHDAAEDEQEAAAEFVAAAAPHRHEEPPYPAVAAYPAAPTPAAGDEAIAPPSEPMASPPYAEPPGEPAPQVQPPAEPAPLPAAVTPAQDAPSSASFPPLPELPEPLVRPQTHDEFDDASSAERVGRLEEEMARLLGEITSRRRSGS